MVEVERIIENVVEIEKLVEVEKLIEKEVEVEVEVEVERIVEVEVEKEVEVLVEVEKEVGVDFAEVEQMQRDLETEAERERTQLLGEQQQDRDAAMAAQEELVGVKQQIRNDRDEQIRAAHRLKELQSKLVVGGENLLDRSRRQADEQRELEEELAERRRQEQQLAAELEAEEEARLGLEEQYSSLQEEIEGKTRKLKKLWGKYKAAQAEVQDQQNEFQREKEDILDTVRELSRQLKLRQLIMTSYIPLEQLSKIERCSEWDEATEQWRINRLQYAGNKVKKRGGDGGADSSPMRNRKGGSKEDAPVADISTAMSAVFFSYDPDPEAMAEADPEELAAAGGRAAQRDARKKKLLQAKLDAAVLN